MDIGLSEKSKAFQYAILCNKISQILKKKEAAISLSNQEYETLSRGAKLLAQIIEGSLLVEGKGKMDGFSASQEGLSAYGHALSAIARLNLIKENNAFTDLFLEFHNSLSLILMKAEVKSNSVDELKNFFDKLSLFFSEDIERDIYGKPKEQKIGLLSTRNVQCYRLA